MTSQSHSQCRFWEHFTLVSKYVQLTMNGNYQDAILRKGLLSITKTGYYKVVPTEANDYLVALKFFQNGHTDMIDNLLYATALSNRCQFLTIDDELRRFINDKKFENVILIPKDI